MKIAILGGTGDLGKGLALRWARSYEIIVGSRSAEKAQRLAEEYEREAKAFWGKSNIRGLENERAVQEAEAVVISIPYEYVPNYLEKVGPFFKEGQVVISPIVPFEKKDGAFVYTPYEEELSAAEFIARRIKSPVVSAFHTVPAKELAKLGKALDYDVLLASDDEEAARKVADLVSEIENLRPLYAGPLHLSYHIEALLPVILNVGMRNGIKSPSIKVVGIPKKTP